jgi:hypothetical protein
MSSNQAKSQALEIGLRVLDACSSFAPPAAADEAYLRTLTGDMTAPIDDLACQIIQIELRKLRTNNKAEIAGAAPKKPQGHAA